MVRAMGKQNILTEGVKEHSAIGSQRPPHPAITPG